MCSRVMFKSLHQTNEMANLSVLIIIFKLRPSLTISFAKPQTSLTDTAYYNIYLGIVSDCCTCGCLFEPQGGDHTSTFKPKAGAAPCAAFTCSRGVGKNDDAPQYHTFSPTDK